jgi:hypothetical protein
MLLSFIKLLRQSLWAFVILFALQTVAQPVITYHSKVEESEKYKNGNEYQKDFLLFMDMLQTTHPAFEKNPPFDVGKELEQGYAHCGKCKDLQEFVSYIQQVAAKIHDAHTGVNFSALQDLAYPFHLYIDEGGYYLDVVPKGNEASLGKQISKINDKEMSFFYNQFKKFFNTNNDAGYKVMFKNNASLFYLWHGMGLCERDSSINLTFTDGSSLKLYPVPTKSANLSTIQKTPSFVEKMLQQSGKLPFSYQILDGGICYLLFAKCSDRNTYMQQYLPQVANNETLRMRLEQQLKRIPIFTEFLDSMFHDMKEKNIKTLVVDVRTNDGGNSALCEELLSRLKSSITSTRTEVRPSQLAEEYYKAIGLDVSLLHSSTGEHSVIQGSKTPFDGKVIWIQGEKTFSSAGLLITMAVDNHIGTVIGEPASYSPTHYGDLIIWSLPNTQTTGYISHKLFVRPDATKGDEIPLAKIFPTSFEDYVNGIDPCYNWVINH